MGRPVGADASGPQDLESEGCSSRVEQPWTQGCAGHGKVRPLTLVPSQAPDPGALALSKGSLVQGPAGTQRDHKGRRCPCLGGVILMTVGSVTSITAYVGVRASVARTQPEQRVASRTGCVRLLTWVSTAMPQGVHRLPPARARRRSAGTATPTPATDVHPVGCGDRRDGAPLNVFRGPPKGDLMSRWKAV